MAPGISGGEKLLSTVTSSGSPLVMALRTRIPARNSLSVSGVSIPAPLISAATGDAALSPVMIETVVRTPPTISNEPEAMTTLVGLPTWVTLNSYSPGAIDARGRFSRKSTVPRGVAAANTVPGGSI